MKAAGAGVPVLLVLLAACATPQEQCILNATAEYRQVNQLVAQVEGNLARGYAIREDFVEFPVMVACMAPGWVGDGAWMQGGMCMDTATRVVETAIPIDPDIERRKLANLKSKQAQLARTAEPAIAACREAYPATTP